MLQPADLLMIPTLAVFVPYPGAAVIPVFLPADLEPSVMPDGLLPVADSALPTSLPQPGLARQRAVWFIYIPALLPNPYDNPELNPLPQITEVRGAGLKHVYPHIA